MIIDLRLEDTEIINDLENKFPNIFKIKIKEDFENNPYTKYLVYLKDEKVVGFLNYYLIYDRIEIVNFNVLENYQNLHIGSNLIERLIEVGNDKKLKNITLEVRIDNQKAIHIYEKYGFKKVSIRKKYYNGMLVKLNESSGTVKQAISIGGYDNGVIDSVVPTNNGGVLLGGWTYSKDVKYNNVSITSSNKGKNEGLIIELNAYNNLVWSDVIQGELYDCINDIVYMGDGSYYAVGDFNSKSITNGNENIKKKVQEDDVLLKNNASYSSDAFVIKYITNTYVPPKKQEGKVTVHHVIEEEYKEWEDDFKKEIKEALNGELEEKPGEVIEIRKGKIGDPYKVEEKDIEHYKLNSAIENAEGTYAEENTDIYVYYVPKDYKYKIEYYYDGEFDSNSTETKEAKYNSTVTVSPSKEKDGYKLVNITSENGENYSNENEVQLKISDDPEKNVIKFYYENTEFKTITVKKVWEMSDEEAENYRATIQLMRVKDGEKTPLLDKEEHEFKVEIIGNRSGTIKNVPVNKGGEPIEYALKEIKVEKRKSPNENNWEEVSLTQFDVSYQRVKGDENN